MNERIELTRDERAAAAEALRESSLQGYGYGFGTVFVLESIIAAINRVRIGDPVGTIRRSPGGSVAVKVREQEMAWELIVPGFTGGHTGTGGVVEWPVIYTPEES